MPEAFLETILQFGTGRFLRAFADLFVHELSDAGAGIGRVVVLQSTGTQRAAAFNAQGGRFHVAIRGLSQGRRIDETVEVQSVGRALAAATDWQQALAVARWDELRLIVSNVTEAGYGLDPADSPGDHPPRSFPAKLLTLLAHRFAAGGSGLTILPCELLERNGERLLALVLEQAACWGLVGPLVDWLRASCFWPSTLVDRIVSSPRPDDPLVADPLAAVAEPFALWLVEGPCPLGGLEAHPAVRRVECLEPYALRKVRILNGAHTALVAKALARGLKTVRQAVEDPAVGPWLCELLFEEIVPVLEGRTEDPAGFARQTLERFANPFLDHRLADIALHHAVKVRTRLVPSYEEFCARFGRPPRLLGGIVAPT
jgi:tagaturonate reductase